MLVAAICAGLPCAGQDAGRRMELQESLESRYHLTVLGGGAMGIHGDNSIRKAGGTVVVMRDGLFGALDRKRITSNAVQDSKVTVVSGDKDVELGRGEKFYVTAVYVGSDVVTLGLVEHAQSFRQIEGRAGVVHGQLLPSPGSVGARRYRQDRRRAGPVDSAGRSARSPSACEGSGAPSGECSAIDEGCRSECGDDAGRSSRRVRAPVQEAAFGEQRWLTYPGMTVVLQQGKLTSVDRNAQALAAVSVSSEPAGADVFLDGSFVSSTPAVLRLQGGHF